MRWREKIFIVLAIPIGMGIFTLSYWDRELSNKLPALVLTGGATREEIKTKYQNPQKKITILIVPGHDDVESGASFDGLREADINAQLGEAINEQFSQDPHFFVHITRTTKGYTPGFAELFANYRDDIGAFRRYVQYYFNLFSKNGVVTPKHSNMHNAATPESATKLYGINWWANGHDIDLLIHIHFNDNPRRNSKKPGIYSGFSIYYPELQLPNYMVSHDIAKILHDELLQSTSASTYAKEKDGLVASQDLIAVGARGSLEPASVLVEYSYIYEPRVQSDELRAIMMQEWALETYRAVKKYFDPVVAEKISKTIFIPTYHWNEVMHEHAPLGRKILSLQYALREKELYPPECSLDGVYSSCTNKAVSRFQESYASEILAPRGLTRGTGIVDSPTLKKLNEIFGK